MSTITGKSGQGKLPGTGLDGWLKLLSLGYEPIPILAAEKRPLVKGWTTSPITEDRLRSWAVQHPDHKSTGCRTGALVGVDVDLTDPGHADIVANAVQEVLGISMFERVGSKGCALYYKNETPIPKIRIFGTPPKGSKPQGVELFGTGGQMVVFGLHPSTKKPYRWENSTILDTPWADLPEVTPDKLWEAARVIHGALAALGYTGLPSVDDMTRDPAPETQQSHDGDPVTPKMLEAMLAHIDPGETGISGSWISVMCGIKYAPLIDAEDFDRLDLFVRWSAGDLNEAHDPHNFEGADDCATHWESKRPQDKRGDGAGLGTIIHLAQRGGYSESIRVNYMERMLAGVESDLLVVDADVADADIPDAVTDWFAPVRALNDRFAIVTGGKQSGFIIDRANPREPHFLNIARFNSIHSHVKILVPLSSPAKKIPVSRVWTGWANRAEITGVVFVPPGAGDVPEGSHNMWQGFAVEPKEGRAHERFLSHIRDNICGGDEDAFEWLITWMADLVKRPGNKPGAALALIGETGAGKSIFYSFLKGMFGTHAASVSDSGKVIGNFNAHMAGLCVLGVEEGFWAGDRRAEAKLRDMITNPTMNMEQKGVDSIEIANHVHIVVTSNEQWVVPVSFDDRRWTVFRVDPSRKNDKAYWKPIHEIDLPGDGPANLLHYLLGRKNSPREMLFTPYGTKAKIDQATETMDSVSQWWLDVLRGDRDPARGHVTSGEDGPDSIFGTDTSKGLILTDYQTWCDANRHLRRLSSNSFWRAFRGIVGEYIKLHKPAAPEGTKERTRHAWLADRETCQTAFASRHKCDWDSLEGYGFGIWAGLSG